MATGRETSGDGYRRLRDAFERLAGTRITTNIVTGPANDPTETTTGFGLIESLADRAAHPRGAGWSVSSVTLSEWLYRAVLAKSVLTLSAGIISGLRKPSGAAAVRAVRASIAVRQTGLARVES